MKFQRLDSISLDQTYYTDEGYLIDHPIVTTCGVFEYENQDGSIRKELRLPEYVFNESSLESYKGKPIIITHDAGEVSKENVRREQIGTIMSKGYQDGDNVRCEIIIHDTNALKRCGLKELSLGYNLDTEETAGVWKGEQYDYIQKNIEINHLALVGEARAGESARLNIDGKDDRITLKGGKATMYKVNQKENRADSGAELSPEEMEAAIALFKAQKVAEQATGEEMDGEEVPEGKEENSSEEEKNPIEKVRENIDHRDSEEGNISPEDIIDQQKADLEVLLSEIDKMQASSDMSGDDKNEQAAESESKILEDEESKTEEKGINMDSVDKRFQDRLDICRMADKLSLDGVENISIKDGRKKVIRTINPKINLDGKSDTYINAAYDIAKDTYNSRISVNEQRQRIMDTKIRKDAKEECNSNTARKNMIHRMTETGGRR